MNKRPNIPALKSNNKKDFACRTSYRPLLIIFSIFFIIVLVMGCIVPPVKSNNTSIVSISNTGTIIPTVSVNNTSIIIVTLKPDPETGLVNWISAVNGKNVSRLYELAPDFIRNNISETDFIAANDGNPILDPGFRFDRYEILNKTSEGDNATIETVITASNTTPKNAVTGIPIWYHFTLTYENNEWKLWTV